jgi:hypothetical protein
MRPPQDQRVPSFERTRLWNSPADTFSNLSHVTALLILLMEKNNTIEIRSDFFAHIPFLLKQGFVFTTK